MTTDRGSASAACGSRPGTPVAQGQAPREPLVGDRVCGICGGANPVVWAAENALWNYVIGGPEETSDPGGVWCIPCFDAELRRRGIYAAWSPGPVDADPAIGLADEIRRGGK